MIGEYHRPEQIEQALALLGRQNPKTVPLGGGTWLSRHQEQDLAVVDLKGLLLNQILTDGQNLVIGATATLQDLMAAEATPPALKRAIEIERSANLRRMATVAGCLVTADGRSPFATAMLALDARLKTQPGELTLSLGEWLPLRASRPAGQLITAVTLPLNATLQVETVARSPMDRPVVIVARAAWPSGRSRIAAGGYGVSPRLALDGPEPGGAADAIWNAFDGGEDPWASAEYRQAAATAVVRRMVTDPSYGR
jgi:CO/xanthine dehydrogenase FAD-binding subunit